MRTLGYHAALLLGALLPAAARAQATVVSAPEKSYILHLTQKWARESPLGDLQQGTVDPNDIELRAWGGYGLGGTTGVIVRRRGGRWQAWRAEVVSCTIDVPIAVGDTASGKTVAGFRATARKNCNTSLGDTRGGRRTFDADSLTVTALGVSAKAIEEAWSNAVDAGALELPPKVQRKWLMLDGFGYVIEVRQGRNYRASVIEHVDPPEVPADAQVKRVYAAIDRLAETARPR